MELSKEDNNRIYKKIMDIGKEIIKESEKIKPYVIIAQPKRNDKDKMPQNFNGYIGVSIDLLGYSHAYVDICNEKIDIARNFLMQQAIESGSEYLFFIGADTIIPYDGFIKFHETALKYPNSMIIGVYYIKLSSPMIMIKKDNKIIPADVTPGKVIETYLAGLDCALIPISILKTLQKDDQDLPFTCVINTKDEYNKDVFIGEDNFFYYRLHKNGIKIYTNTDVQCLHMDLSSGKYTSYPNIDLNNYFTTIPIKEPLTMKDKRRIDQTWIDTIPKNI